MRHNKTNRAAAPAGLLLALLLCAAGCGHKDAEAPANTTPGGGAALPPQAQSAMEAQQRADAAARAAHAPPMKHP